MASAHDLELLTVDTAQYASDSGPGGEADVARTPFPAAKIASDTSRGGEVAGAPTPFPAAVLWDMDDRRGAGAAFRVL